MGSIAVRIKPFLRLPQRWHVTDALISDDHDLRLLAIEGIYICASHGLT